MAREVKVEIIGDASSLQRAFGQAGKASNTLGSRMAKVAKIAVATGAVLGVGVAVGAKKAIDAASDLGEQLSKTGVVFGKSSRDVHKWSESLASSFGLSQRAALEAAGTYGNMLVPMGFSRKEAAGMSKQFVELAADMASFNNAAPTETLDALRAGLAGETEPLRRFGVFLNDARIKSEAASMGFKLVKGQLDPMAKAAATAAIIMKDTADTQGDFGRTSGSLANQQRILKAELENAAAAIGQALLPAATRMLQLLARIIPPIVEFGTRLAEAVGPYVTSAIDGLAAAFGRVSDFVQANWPQIQTIIQSVTDAIAAAFQALARVAEAAWPRIQAAADKVATWYRDHLEPTITSVSRNIARAWDQSGADTKDSTARNFGGIPPLVKAQMQNVVSVVNAGLALLRGDWSTAWNEIRVIPGRTLMSVVDTIKVITRTVAAAAVAMGRAIQKGVVDGLAGIRAAVAGKLAEIGGAISAAAGRVYGWAMAVGRAVVDGILAGVGDLAGRFANSVIGKLDAAKDRILGWAKIGSPSKLFADTIGKPLGEGVVTGTQTGLSGLAAAMEKEIQAATDKARQAVDAARTAYRSTWDTFAGQALQAFDDMASKIVTKSEKLLADLNRKQTVTGLADAVTEARAELDKAKLDQTWNVALLPDETVEQWTARAAAANEAVVNAQKRLNDALLAQQQFRLGEAAAKERQALDERIAVDRINFEKWLAERTVQQQKALVQEGKGQSAIVTKIKSYAPDYRQAGAKLGEAIAIGLRDSAGGVVDAANELAAAIAKALGVASEIAKRASVTTSDKLSEVQRRQHGGPVRAGTPYIVGERGPEIFWPGLSGAVIPNSNTAAGLAGGAGITVNVYGSVTAERDLAETLRVELLRTGRYNAGGVLGGLA